MSRGTVEGSGKSGWCMNGLYCQTCIFGSCTCPCHKEAS